MTPREYIEARLAVLRELECKQPMETEAMVQRRQGKIAAYEDALGALAALEPKVKVISPPATMLPFVVFIEDHRGGRRLRLGKASGVNYEHSNGHLEGVVLVGFEPV